MRRHPFGVIRPSGWSWCLLPAVARISFSSFLSLLLSFAVIPSAGAQNATLAPSKTASGQPSALVSEGAPQTRTSPSSGKRTADNPRRSGNVVRITSASAPVFANPSFDSEILTELPRGTQVEISRRKFDVFHRVRLPDGKLGFLPDSEFLNPELQQKRRDDLQDSENGAPASRPIFDPKQEANKQRPPSGMWGGQFAMLRYRESTLGLRPTAEVPMLGFRRTSVGFFGGTADWSLLYAWAPPSYYQQATGQKASGFLILTDYQQLFESIQSATLRSYLGMGPLLRLNNYQLSTSSDGATATNAYTARDVVLGWVVSAGIEQKWNRVSLRGELKYHMELLHYWGLSFSLLFAY